MADPQPPGRGRPRYLVDDRAVHRRRHRRAHRHRSGEGPVGVAHGNRPGQHIHVPGLDVPAAAGPVAGRGRDQGDLWCGRTLCVGVFGTGGQTQQHSPPTADVFEPGLQTPVAVKLGRQTPDISPDLFGPHENSRNGGINYGHADTPAIGQAQLLPGSAGRQQLAAQRAPGLQVFEPDTRPRSGHAVNRIRALNLGLTVTHRHLGDIAFAGIGRQNPDPGQRLQCRHQALVNGKRTDRSRDIAAGAAPVNRRAADIDLAEGKRHVAIGMPASADDRHLAEGGNAATEPIDLTAVHIGTTQGGQNNPLAGRSVVVGQIVLPKTDRPARAAAHEYRWDPVLHRPLPSWAFRLIGTRA